jgi:RNA polymerase primary sigma factor
MSMASRSEDGLSAAEALALHEGFVRSRVMRWVGNLPFLGMFEDDLMQEGRLGIWHAAQRFDAGRGVTFLTFAGKFVDHMLLNFVNRRANVVRTPRGMGVSLLSLDVGRSKEEGNKIEEMLRLAREDGDVPRWWGDDGVRALLQASLARLSEVEVTVLRARFVEEVPRSVTGRRMGRTRERVRQIERAAMEKLRRWMLPAMGDDERRAGVPGSLQERD